MRNMIQHQGVLPAANQLPLWLAETEKLIDFLVDRSFGVSLTKVGSASGDLDRPFGSLQDGLEQVAGRLECRPHRYGAVAALQPDANLGRVLAAYGGVFSMGRSPGACCSIWLPSRPLRYLLP